MLTCGHFEYDEATGTLSGPADYMTDKGNAKLEGILSGNDPVFNLTSRNSPSIEMAILVSLQTDYAGWRGVQRMFATIDNSY